MDLLIFLAVLTAPLWLLTLGVALWEGLGELFRRRK